MPCRELECPEIRSGRQFPGAMIHPAELSRESDDGPAKTGPREPGSFYRPRARMPEQKFPVWEKCAGFAEKLTGGPSLGKPRVATELSAGDLRHRPRDGQARRGREKTETTMRTLVAQPIVNSVWARLKADTAELTRVLGRAPHLAVVLVGEDPASRVYVEQKEKAARELGMTHRTLRLPAGAPLGEFRALVAGLNADAAVDGILVQRPTPIPGLSEEELACSVTPAKDVDGFHPESVGRLALGLPGLRSCTPAGVMRLLAHYGIPVAGKVACVIGRSAIVGKPLAALLLQADATVLHAHRRTPDLAALTRQADLVFAAAGQPGLIRAEHLKPGAIVIDIGISRDAQGKLRGDVDFDDASRVAGAISPVPGGAGRMTILQLMENTLAAARSHAGKSAGKTA